MKKTEQFYYSVTLLPRQADDLRQSGEGDPCVYMCVGVAHTCVAHVYIFICVGMPVMGLCGHVCDGKARAVLYI